MTFDFGVPRSRFDEKGKRIRPCPAKGRENRRILREETVTEDVEVGGRAIKREYEYSFHATKGWRRRWQTA